MSNEWFKYDLDKIIAIIFINGNKKDRHWKKVNTIKLLVHKG